MEPLFLVLAGVFVIAAIVLVLSCLSAASRADDQLEGLTAAKRKAWGGEVPKYKPPTLSSRAAKGIAPKDAA